MRFSSWLLLSLTLLAISGCKNYQPTICGDTLKLPAECQISQVWPGIPEFHRFDEEYPEYWPTEFPLPDGSFTREAHIKAERVPAIRGATQLSEFDKGYLQFTYYNVLGVAPGSAEEFKADFLEKAKNIGVNAKFGEVKQQEVPYPPLTRVWMLLTGQLKRQPKMPRHFALSAFEVKSKTHPKLVNVHVYVYEDSKLSDWTMYRVKFSVLKQAPDE